MLPQTPPAVIETAVPVNQLTNRSQQFATTHLQSTEAPETPAHFRLEVSGSQLASSGQAITLLFPFYHDDEQALFAQGRVSRLHNAKNTGVSLGVGQRLSVDGHWWIGYNLFYDSSWEQHHYARLGLGLEARQSYLTLALNGYYPLSSWRDDTGSLFAYRPARSVDVVVSAYLPAYPQLGISVKGEHHLDKQLFLAQKPYSPSNFSLALHYTPVPLLTIGYSYQMGYQSFENQKQFQLQLNYQLGVPLKEQLSSTAVAHYRQLAGSQLEPVQRSYQMVLARQSSESARGQLEATAIRAVEAHDSNPEIRALVDYFRDNNNGVDDELRNAVFKLVSEYHQADRDVVILRVLKCAKDLQRMGSWNNTAGELVAHLMTLAASWPRDTRLVVETTLGGKALEEVHGEGSKQIRIQHANDHYRAVINGQTVEAGGGGDCFYHAILAALGKNNSAEEVRKLRNELARLYLSNPTIPVIGARIWELT